MALLNLMGFDHFKTAGYGSTQSSIFGNQIQSMSTGLIPFPGAADGVVLTQVLSNSNGNWAVTEVTLSSGKVRKFLTTQASNSRLYWALSNAYMDQIPKPGKWHLGMRVYLPANTGSTMLQMRCGPASPITLLNSAVGVYYVEVEIDWVALTVKTYLNGVLQNTYSGATYVDPTYTGKYIYMGNITVTTSVNGITDHYFQVEEAADVGTLSRLGPILVKPQPWQLASNVDKFTPPGSLSVLDQFNANNAMGNNTGDTAYASYNVLSSAHGEIGTLQAGAPTETQQIVGVQLTTLVHKLQAAAAGVTQQIVQGSNQTTASKTIPGLVTTPSRKSYMFLKALDATAWSNEKVGQIKLNIGSYRP